MLKFFLERVSEYVHSSFDFDILVKEIYVVMPTISVDYLDTLMLEKLIPLFDKCS